MSYNWKELGIELKTSKSAGQTKTICPNCKDTRSDKSDRSLSCNLTTGAYNCHYCGFTGYAKDPSDNFKFRDMSEKKPFKRPNVRNNTNLSDKAVKWFKSRGISQQTLVKMRIGEGLEYMPQHGKEMNTIQFNYFKSGELVNIKFRTGDKKFKLVSGAELIFYNLDSVVGKKDVIVTEGECFDDKAQVLTENGWKLFSEIDYSTKIATYKTDGSIAFEFPKHLIVKRFDGNLIEFKNSRNNYYSLTTPEHNIVVTRKDRLFKLKANEISSQIGIPRSGVYSGEGLDISDDLLRLYIAISADFTIRKSGNIYGAFKKERKYDRIKMLLENLNIRHTINKVSRDYYSVFIHNGHGLNPFKKFPHEWIPKLSKHQIELILSEIIYWDGNHVKGRTMTEYNSNIIENIEFIQTLCHLSNRCSTICKRKNEHGEWYKATILQKNLSSTSKKYSREVEYHGNVYCATVESGMLLVRQNNLITVSGNCDALSFVEVGFESVVSVPNGGKNIGDYLDDYLEEYFSDKETIYIASDTDSVGVGLRDELIKRFGAERCKIVTYGEGCKDANEHLIKYGQESLRNTIKTAYEPKLDGVFKLEDFQDNLDKLYSDGLQAGLKIGHKNIDDKITWETKRLAIITGVPSSGKSEFIDEICTRLNILHGWKVGYFSPENSPMELHISKIVSKITGKKFSKESLSYAEYKQAKEYINNNFFFTNPSDNYSISNILDKAKILVRKHGIKVFVIDPYNNIDPERGSSESEGDEVRYKLKKMQDFCRRNDVLLMLMAHPRKMIKRDDGSFEVPTMYDISGSAHFYNMADYGLAVARDYVNQSVDVHIQKVKFKHLGENGMATFKYNFPNGRYVPYSGEAVINWDNSNMLVEKIKQDESNADIPIEYQYDDTNVMPNNNFYTQSNDECPF